MAGMHEWIAEAERSESSEEVAAPSSTRARFCGEAWDRGGGQAGMVTFLICHGAWSAGWAWRKMRPLLRAAGHEVFTPTYTGLGERAHLASRSITLDTHIADVLGVIECEDLRD